MRCHFLRSQPDADDVFLGFLLSFPYQCANWLCHLPGLLPSPRSPTHSHAQTNAYYARSICYLCLCLALLKLSCLPLDTFPAPLPLFHLPPASSFLTLALASSICVSSLSLSYF